MAAPAPFSVTVHPFPSSTPRSCAYEYGPSGKTNALIFIGGLTAGPHSSSLPHHLAEGLAHSELDFGVWEFRMRSSYTGFGFSSVANDAEDTGAFVTYLRKLGKSKIVLMGLSTGKHGPQAVLDTGADSFVSKAVRTASNTRIGQGLAAQRLMDTCSSPPFRIVRQRR
jgi:hypothetical protein